MVDLKSELIHIDTLHTGQMESEFDAWGSERAEKPTGRTVDVDRDVKTSLLLNLVENLGDFLDGFVMASICGSKDDENAL